MFGVGSMHTINTVVLAGEGRLIAAGTVDKVIRVFEERSPQQPGSGGGFEETARYKNKFGSLEAVGKLAMSPDGVLLLASTDICADKIFVWKAANPFVSLSARTCVQTVKVKTLTASADDLDVQALAFSPDDGRLAVGLTGELVLCKADPSDGTVRALQVLSVRGRKVCSLAWAPGGLCVAAGDEQGMVWVWEQNPQPGSVMQLVAELQQNSACLEAAGLAFSPYGDQLVMAAGDGIMYVWKRDEVSGWVAATTVGQAGGGKLSSVAFQPDGQCIAVGSKGVVNISNVIR
jgi:WD40 repeat protein